MKLLLTAAAFAALIAGPVAAQTTSTTAQTSTTAAGDQTATDPAADTPPVDASTSTTLTTEATVPTTSTSGGLMTSAQVVVTANAPIPDTPENRARYGLPDSNAGKARIGEGPVESLPRAR